ncbi:putative guanosine-diphosphatase [Leucoagaricus sp. SymC.cos]|nr:putative guanosine-diphosphatase [Leucoagaricus sp. SymC.cos]
MAGNNLYERLEGGLGPQRGSGGRHNWKKYAIIAGLVIGVLWFAAPRRENYLGWNKDKDLPSAPYDDDIEKVPSPGHDTSNEPSNNVVHPTSWDNDPDPSKTTHCTTPYSPNSRLVQYAMMIDAGSTGSRIHVYKFNNCGSSPEYEYEVFKMINPGLSHYAGKPEEAAKSLDVLLDEAVRVIPKSLQNCAPVAVKATAGLRLLPGSQSDDILHAVENRLHDNYPFPLIEKDPVVVMDGKEEGVYAWITANYLLNTIRPDTPKNTPTYAVLDLGGASTQIVFEPVFSSKDGRLEEGEHKYDLTFGGKKRTLYQHSYLGYGLMRARRHVHKLVDFMSSIRIAPSNKETEHNFVGNPCLAKGTRRIVEFDNGATVTSRNVTMDGDDIGSFEACDRIIQLVLAKDAICELKPCSFNGMYQPSLLDTFPSGKVFLLSYFYDRIFPLLSTSQKSKSKSLSEPTLNVSVIANLADLVCRGRTEWVKHWGSDGELMDELEGRPEYCLDLTFMHALLRMGYEFEDNREVMIGKKIDGTELGWCLGATIAIVGGELTCRA